MFRQSDYLCRLTAPTPSLLTSNVLFTDNIDILHSAFPQYLSFKSTSSNSFC